MFHPLAAEYQGLFQRIEDRLTYDSEITMDESAEITAELGRVEDDAIQQARTAVQELVKIQQLKLEAFARSTQETHVDLLSAVHQQTCEIKEIDNELFDVVMLMRHYRY